MSGDLHNKQGMSVQIEVVITTAWSDDEQCYYAWSPQLGCMRDGDTVERAKAMCKEALEVRFESLMERDTLDEYLRQHDYTVTRVKGQPSRFDRPSGSFFDLTSAKKMMSSKSLHPVMVDGVMIEPEVPVANVG